MIKSLLAILITLISVSAYSQQSTAEIKMVSEYGSENAEVSNILVFQNIDYYQTSFTGKSVKNKHFVLLAKEMWDGEVSRIDTIVNTLSQGSRGKINSDTLTVTVIGSRIDNDKLKIYFRFPMFVVTRKYDATASDDYSLRSIGSDLKITSDKAFPAFAYILPYEDGNWKMYCAVDQSGEKVEDWGKKFKIKHYIIFEMKFFQ